MRLPFRLITRDERIYTVRPDPYLTIRRRRLTYYLFGFIRVWRTDEALEITDFWD